MREDEVEVTELVRAAQVLDAVAVEKRLDRLVAPLRDQALRLLVLWLVAELHEARGDPRRTELILLPELSAGAGSDDRHVLVPCRRATLRLNVAQRGGIGSLRAPGLVQDLSPRGREQNDGPTVAGLRRQRRRAVLELEAERDAAAELSHELWILELCRRRESVLEGRHGKAPPAERNGRLRCRRRPDHIHRDDGMVRDVSRHARREAVDDDGRHRETVADTLSTDPEVYPARAMRFSVVIATLRRPELLRETLASVVATVPPPREIVVVDGDEAGSAREVVESISAPAGTLVSYVAGVPNVTHQRNEGTRVASGDVVVFVDDDVELDTRFFAALSAAYEDPKVVGATGRVIEPQAHRVGDHRSRVRRWLLAGGRLGTFTTFGYPRYILDTTRAQDLEMMPGCLMTARRELALAVGFDESLEGYALAEDEDFSYRLSRHGRIRFDPAVSLWHKKLGFGERDPRAFNRKVVVNRAYLFRKNFPQTIRARTRFVLLILLMITHRVANRDAQGARGLLEGSVEAWRRR